MGSGTTPDILSGAAGAETMLWDARPHQFPGGIIGVSSGGAGAFSAFNVQSFGATGLGVVDDAPAIQAAMNAAAATVGATGLFGGMVYVPPGLYKVGSKLLVPNGVWLVGNGFDASVIQGLASLNDTAVITNSDHTGNQEFFGISGLRILNGAATTSLAVLDVEAVFLNSFIRDLLIENGTNAGLMVGDGPAAGPGNCGPVELRNLWVHSNGTDNIVFQKNCASGTMVGMHCYSLAVENCGQGHANLHVNAAIAGAGVVGIGLWGCHFEQGTGNGSNVHLLFDGPGGNGDVIGDNLQMLTGNSAGMAAGIKIANGGRYQFRAVRNPNLINPIINDTVNTASYGAVHLPWYITPDIALHVGSSTITVP